MSKTTDKRQKAWDEQDIEYLRNNAGKLPEKDIAALRENLFVMCDI